MTDNNSQRHPAKAPLFEMTIRVNSEAPLRAAHAIKRGVVLSWQATRAVARRLRWLAIIVLVSAVGGIIKGLFRGSVEHGAAAALALFALGSLGYGAALLKRRFSPLVRD